jgi:hypothetical protein
MIRANRTPQSKNGDSGSAHVFISEPDPDLVPCEHCGRRFNETAAERHIPICAQTKHRTMLKQHNTRSPSGPSAATAGGGGNAADEALRKRMSFKPPPPKLKKAGSSASGMSVGSGGSNNNGHGSATSSPRRR